MVLRVRVEFRHGRWRTIVGIVEEGTCKVRRTFVMQLIEAPREAPSPTRLDEAFVIAADVDVRVAALPRAALSDVSAGSDRAIAGLNDGCAKRNQDASGLREYTFDARANCGTPTDHSPGDA